MITKEKRLCSFIKFSQVIFNGNWWRSVWRICMLILGLKGLRFEQWLIVGGFWSGVFTTITKNNNNNNNHNNLFNHVII